MTEDNDNINEIDDTNIDITEHEETELNEDVSTEEISDKQKRNQLQKFELREDGVYVLQGKGKKSYYAKFCSPLKIVAGIRDDSSDKWGRLLEITAHDGVIHKLAMPVSMLAGGGQVYRELFLSKGLVYMSWAENYLHEYLIMTKPSTLVRCTDKVGWYHTCYVLPERIYGSSEGEEVVFQSYNVPPRYEIKGTLQEWQDQIGRYCENNSRLILAVTAALAGPLLHLIEQESGGFHFVGGSSCGKSTALDVAASVWGTAMSSWRTTDNAAENLALGANDNLLCLDEISQSDAKVAGEMVYMLANGKRKSRASANMLSRPEGRWRLIFLSSGEVTLQEKLNEGAKAHRAGQDVRLVNIPADVGGEYRLFGDVHNFGGGNQFSIHLKNSTKNFCGTLGDAFLHKIVEDTETLKKNIRKRVDMWCKNNVSSGDDGQVQRVGSRFALLAAAGEIAVEMGLLPWSKGYSNKAIKQCFAE